MTTQPLAAEAPQVDIASMAGAAQCRADCLAAARWARGPVRSRVAAMVDEAVQRAPTIDVWPQVSDDWNRTFAENYFRLYAETSKHRSGVLGWLALQIFLRVCVAIIVDWWLNRGKA